MEINLSIINPKSDKYHCLQTFKENLTGRQRVAAIAAAIFGSIIPVLGTTAAFRKVVQHYHREIPAEWQDPNFIKLPTDGAGIAADTKKLAEKLIKQGINLENFKFKRIWTHSFAPGNNNAVIGNYRGCRVNHPGGSERASYSSIEDIDLFDAIPKEENLILVIIHEDEKAAFKRRIGDRAFHTCLTYAQAFGRERLPREFIDFVKNV
jgi:hypothetical protein